MAEADRSVVGPTLVEALRKAIGLDPDNSGARRKVAACCSRIDAARVDADLKSAPFAAMYQFGVRKRPI